MTILPLFGGHRLCFARQRRVQRVPRQRRALDATGELTHPGEDGELTELRRSPLAGLALGQHCAKPLEDLFGLGHRLALEVGRHHRSRGPGDSATRTLKADVTDELVLSHDLNRHAVTAERVVALRSLGRTRQPPEVPRLPVVIEDDLLIQLAELGHHPKTSRTLPSPLARASISSCVL